MRKAPTAMLLAGAGLLLILGAGSGPSDPPFSQWPAPPADAIVPDANQQITVLWPLPGQRYTSTDHLHIEYRTGDGVPAELYVDGQHIPNDSEVALCRYALGTHKVRVNPLMHPEKAQEVDLAPPNWSREMVAWAGKEGLDEEAKDRRADRGDIAGRGECRDA